MATAVGAGFDLSKLLSEFTRLDKELEKFMQKGKTFEKNWQDIFNNMGKGGLKNFASQLASVRKSVVDFGKQKVGVQWDSKSLQKYIDDVNKLILVIKAVQKETKKENIKGVSIVGLKKELKEAQELLVLVKRAEKSLKETSTNRQQTYKGSLRYSSNAKTVEQDIQAIKNLEAARAKLKRTDSDYEKKLSTLNNRIREHKKRIDDAKKGAQELQDKHNGLINTGEQLKRALIGVFSVSAIKGYVNKLVEVRGEFELQHRALGVLVGDIEDANRLWDKTVALAIKSPFAVKELITYTKQLAAYRVESDKLYDTTKMLADISAGLGVDMNRLILAYGQVKAANYLRGTELRQFSEAGINILSELSKYFTELEGRAVSVGDVFDRVSKRMVSFADVEAVLQSVTGVGGQFYKMQEQQAETLKGIWMNLRDSVDLMLNEIGERNDSILKGILAIAKETVDNWERVGDIIVPLFSFIVSRMAIMKTMSFLDTKPWDAAIDRMKYFGMMLTQGKSRADEFARSIQGLDSTSLVKGAWGTAITAVILLVSKLAMEWVKHNAEIKAVNEEYAKLKETVSEITFGFNTAQLDSDIDKQKEKLTELISIANKEYNLNIKINVKDLTDEEIDEQFKGIANQIVNASAFAQESTIALKGKWWDFLFGNRAEKDMQQYGDAFSETSAKIINNSRLIANNLIKLKEGGEELTEIQEAALKTFTTPFDPKKETEAQYVNKLIGAYRKLNNEISKRAEIESQGHSSLYSTYYARWAQDLGIVSALTSNLDRHKDEATRELNNWLEDISSNLTGTTDENAIYLKTAIDKQSWTSATKELAYMLANEKFDFNITPIIKQPEEKSLADWQIEYNKFVETLSTNKVLKMDANTDAAQYISILKGTYETYAKEVKAWDSGNAKARAQYSKEEIEAIRKQNAERKEALDWLVYEEKKKSEENEALQRLKKQISLIREAAKAYDDMRKLHDEAYASERIVSDYEEAFKEAGLGNIEQYAFGTREDERNNLNKLENSAKRVKGGMLELSKAIAQVSVNIDDANQGLTDKKLFDAISDIFSDYEISLEMDKLNIPSDLAEKLFGFESIDINEIRGKVLEKFGLGSMVGTSNQGIYDSAQFKAMSKERQDELRKSLEKESELQDNALKERLKTYTQYLKKEQDERIKLKLEELRKLEEVEGMNEFNEEQKAVIKNNIRSEAEAELLKKSWESFEKSPDFLNLFDDISRSTTQSLVDMRTQLDKLRGSMLAAGLPASDLKEILDKINQVEEELDNREPFKAMKEDWKTLFGADYKHALEDEKRLLEERDALRTEQKEIEKSGPDDYQLNILNSEKEKLEQMVEGTEEYENQKQLIADITAALYPNQQRYNEILELLKQNGIELDEVQQKTRNWKDACLDIAESFNEIGNAVNQVGGALGTTLEQLGLMSEESKAIYDSHMNMANDLFGLGSNVMQLVANPTNPQAWIGAITNAISLIGNIAATGDAVREKQIQEEMKNIDRLERAYEKLEKAMDDAYTFDQMRSNRMSIEQNIDEQIKALESANAKEEAMKKKDQDQIDANYEKIAELEEKKAELQRETVERLGGTYDYASVAEQFLDAWLEAFKETGDGLSGLEDNFDEFFSELAKKQLIYGGLTKLIEPLQTAINAELEDNQQVDDWGALIKEYGNVITNINNFLTGAVSNLESAGLDIFSGDGSELSGLSKGIQGMSEETSNILVAYWNAVRFDVSAIRQRFDDFMSMQGYGDEVNPVENHLKTISMNTTAMLRLLEDARGDSEVNAIRVKVLNM